MSRITHDEVLKALAERHGFLDERIVADLLYLGHGTLPVLIRCGGHRFSCTVAQVPARMAAVEKSGDYVRDVSIPAGEPGMRWKAVNLDVYKALGIYS